jgi:hypothetical protein
MEKSMSDKHDADSWDESEFGLGPGFIDPISRANRNVTPVQELAEIYALPKTFGGSGGDAERDPATTPVPRLAPGETEADRG